MKSHLRFLVVVLGVGFVSAPARGTPYYVNGTCGSNSYTGASPTCGISSGPKATIQAGMNLAVNNGDVVNVAVGIYTGTGNRDLVFPQSGGSGKVITIKCSCPANCVIDVQGSNPCVNDPPSKHRGFWFKNVHAPHTYVVDGFTIKNGCIWSFPYNGGGILIDHSAPTIRNCILVNNKASSGGGIAMEGSSPNLLFVPLIDNCVIKGNEALFGKGGGIFADVHMDPIVTNSRIADNTAATLGGGLSFGLGSDPRIERCAIEGNTADGGGGVYAEAVKQSIGQEGFKRYILRSRIGPNNTATTANGGGLWFNATSSLGTSDIRVYIENSTIIQNHADTSFGGGVSFSGASVDFPMKVTMVNTVIAGNTAASGGGVHIDDYTPATMANVTLMHNKAVGGNTGGEIFFDGLLDSLMDNAVLWYDTSRTPQTQIRIGGSSSNKLSVRYSDVKDTLPSGVIGSNNISSDPLFVDLDGDDNDLSSIIDNNYRLPNESLCNDRGSVLLVPPDELDLDADPNTTVHVPLDRDGLDRYVNDPPGPYDGALDEPNGYTEYVDIGAYERGECTSDANCIDPPDSCFGNGSCVSGACKLNFMRDCNWNGREDMCDGATGTYFDCDNDGMLDACEMTTPDNVLIAGVYECQDSLPRTQGNLLRLTYKCTLPPLPASPTKPVQIRTLAPAGGYGMTDLAGSFLYAIEGTCGNILQIKENGTALGNTTWYGITRNSAWTGVASFKMDYVTVYGDADNTLLNDFADLSFIFGNYTSSPSDQNRSNINADGAVNQADIDLAFLYNGSFAPNKPTEHTCTVPP